MSIVVKDAVVILCGGSSTRMGQDKATLIYNEKSFLEHAIIKAIQLSKEVLISVKTKEQELFYTTLLSKFGNFNTPPIQFLIDEFDFDGPLNGVFTSINYTIASDIEYAQFIPIDIPAITLSDLTQLRSASISKNAAISSYIGEESFLLSMLFYLNITSYKDTWKLLINSADKLIKKRVAALFRIAPTLFLLKIPDQVSTRFNNINTRADYQQLLKKEFEEVIYARSELTNSPSIFKHQLIHGITRESLKEELTGCTIPHLQRDIEQDMALLN